MTADLICMVKRSSPTCCQSKHVSIPRPNEHECRKKKEDDDGDRILRDDELEHLHPSAYIKANTRHDMRNIHSILACK
jgi:hypothetical protein